jgi:thymidine kinase
MQALPRDTGWIEIICGPMFSGKTEELIRRLRRALFARQVVQAFKPRIDSRYDPVAIVSHNGQTLNANPVRDANEILEQVQEATEIVAIDEGQFFDRTLVDVAQALAEQQKRVIIAGLDQDFTGAPFEPIPELMAVAEFVSKNLAICVVCGNPAGRTQRLGRQSRRVVVGATETYEARCRRCHTTEPSLPEQGPLFKA